MTDSERERLLAQIHPTSHLGRLAQIAELEARLAAVERERGEAKRLHRECWQDLRYMTDWRNKHMDEHPYERDVEALRAERDAAQAALERMREQMAWHEADAARLRAALIEARRVLADPGEMYDALFKMIDAALDDAGGAG